MKPLTQNEIVELTTQLYKDNIDYLENNQYYLYTKIKKFEDLNEENYYLDFSDKGFELCKINGTKIYNCDPFIDAQQRMQNLSKNISGISTIKTSKLDIYKNNSYDATKILNQYINLMQSNIPDIPKYEKFIFIGTLLGVHLNEIDNHINAQSYLIVENSIEIFRLSLFLTDYKKLGNNSDLFFSIEDSYEKLEKTINSFLQNKYKYNAFIKFEILSVDYVDLLNNCTNIISSANKMIYPFSEYIENYENSIKNFKLIKNGILNLSLNKKILDSLPIFFIASGPSLKNNIGFIKKHSNRFLIVTVLSSLKRLESANIIPDIIISIDGNYIVKDSLSINDKYYKDSIILTSTSTHHKLISEIENDNIYLFQTGFILFDDIKYAMGISVGDIAISLILLLGAKDIYLAGFDVALDQTTGRTNDDTHISKDKIVLSDKHNANYDYYHSLTTVKGNLTKEVKTTIYYNMILNSFNNIISKYQNIDIHNLSNGAYLKNTTPIKENNIDINRFKIIDKNILKTKMINQLSSISKTTLTKEDKHSQSIEEDIVTNFEKYKSNENILSSSFTGQIIKEFNYLVDPYIYFIENNIDQNLTQELSTIKANQLNQILEVLKN